VIESALVYDPNVRLTAKSLLQNFKEAIEANKIARMESRNKIATASATKVYIAKGASKTCSQECSVKKGNSAYLFWKQVIGV